MVEFIKSKDAKTTDFLDDLAGKTFSFSGVFVRYGDDAYDWVFVSLEEPDLIAKLQGVDKDGYFTYDDKNASSAGIQTRIDFENRMVEFSQ